MLNFERSLGHPEGSFRWSYVLLQNADVFLIHHRIFELPRPINVELCYMIRS